MSSIYVLPVEIRDNDAPAETFWLSALMWVWDASQFWDVVHDDLKLRNYSLVTFGEARNWHGERKSWPDNCRIETLVTEKSKENRVLWCENKTPILE